MRIRPYIEERDYEYLREWVDNDRLHALWCAGRLPYPADREELRNLLRKNESDYAGSAYVATEDDGKTVGFFCYGVDPKDSAGFLSCIIVDGRKRGRGYGRQMLMLALAYAFDITKAESVSLNVFTENSAAIRCYESLGFTVQGIERGLSVYKDELWDRYRMTVDKEKSILS